MNRYDACHLWDRNRNDLNSFFFYFAMARINVCFNVSFLDFNQYCK